MKRVLPVSGPIVSSGCAENAVVPVAELAATAAAVAPLDIAPVSGISKDVPAAVARIGEQTVVFYCPDRADAAQLRAAPARLCADAGGTLRSAEDKAHHHPEEMPGARQLMIFCNL